MPKQLHSLFVIILIFGEPAKPDVLWRRYKEVMGEDTLRHMPSYAHISQEQCRRHVDNEVLFLLEEELEGMGSCLEKFGLPIPNVQNIIQRMPKVIADEMFPIESHREISNLKCGKLNTDQQDAFCTIMKAVYNDQCPQRLLFLNAPGGYGKTFLIETLLSSVRGMGKIALAVTSS